MNKSLKGVFTIYNISHFFHESKFLSNECLSCRCVDTPISLIFLALLNRWDEWLSTNVMWFKQWTLLLNMFFFSFFFLVSIIFLI